MIRPCPHRCFLSELPEQLDSVRRSFRLMGTVVEILHGDDAGADDLNAAAATSTSATLHLDDGTGRTAIFMHRCMVEKLQLARGDAVECVARVVPPPNTEDRVLVADQLVRVQDPHAVPLRWLELVHRGRLPGDVVSGDVEASSTEWGYPCRSHTPDDILQIIAAEAALPHKAGVALGDLAVVLDLDEDRLSTMIEELQLAGQIYQNETGRYLPL